MYVALKKEEK